MVGDAARVGDASALRRVSTRALVGIAPLLALWVVLAWGLSAITTRSRDWFDMTDELRYERLAISIARTHSLVPRTHGVDIHSFSQLYPLLIAPGFAHGYVPHDLHVAHLLNGWIMSSACIPAFLLARRVTGRCWQAYVVALLSVCMPWILYSTMLMTEVAAYPAFLWAVLALQRATTAPSARRDVVALAAVALAYFARAELIVLLIVPPIAILAYEIGRARTDGPARLGDVLRRSVRLHRVVVGAYGVVVVAAVALALAGRLASVVGVYGIYAVSSSLLPASLFGSFAEHAAIFSLGLAILPFLVGTAWLGSNLFRPARSRETHAFACIGSTVVAAVLLQSTEFDVRWTGYVHDRFLLYLAPLVVLGVLCALDDRRRPGWSLIGPVAPGRRRIRRAARSAAPGGSSRCLIPTLRSPASFVESSRPRTASGLLECSSCRRPSCWPCCSSSGLTSSAIDASR